MLDHRRSQTGPTQLGVIAWLAAVLVIALVLQLATYGYP